MFKKLVQALGKVPGLGSLRRRIGGLADDLEAPVADEKRRPEPRIPEIGSPEQRPGPPGSPAVQNLGLAAIGPGRAFAFWKLSRQAIGRARDYLCERSGGEQATAVVLRVHDITLVDFDGSNARRTMDLSIGEGTVGAAPQNTETIEGNRYLELWTDGVLPPRSPQGDGPDTPSPTRIYCELGVLDSAGEFVAVAWSPILDLPIMAESPRGLPVRALVNGEHSARWRPRLEPLPSSSPFEAASATSSTAPHGALTTGETPPPGTSRVAPVAVDLPASNAWTFSAPSSADLVSGRDRQRGPGGVSSELLVRRRLPFRRKRS